MTLEDIFRYFCGSQTIEVYSNSEIGVIFTGKVEDIPQHIYRQLVSNVYTVHDADVIYITVD